MTIKTFGSTPLEHFVEEHAMVACRKIRAGKKGIFIFGKVYTKPIIKLSRQAGVRRASSWLKKCFAHFRSRARARVDKKCINLNITIQYHSVWPRGKNFTTSLRRRISISLNFICIYLMSFEIPPPREEEKKNTINLHNTRKTFRQRQKITN